MKQNKKNILKGQVYLLIFVFSYEPSLHEYFLMDFDDKSDQGLYITLAENRQKISVVILLC